jgi:hypothetical protein
MPISYSVDKILYMKVDDLYAIQWSCGSTTTEPLECLDGIDSNFLHAASRFPYCWIDLTHEKESSEEVKIITALGERILKVPYRS